MLAYCRLNNPRSTASLIYHRCIEPSKTPDKPKLLHRDPANKPRSVSSKLLMLIAIIIVGALAFMVFHMVTTPQPPHSAPPIEQKKTGP